MEGRRAALRSSTAKKTRETKPCKQALVSVGEQQCESERGPGHPQEGRGALSPRPPEVLGANQQVEGKVAFRSQSHGRLREPPARLHLDSWAEGLGGGSPAPPTPLSGQGAFWPCCTGGLAPPARAPSLAGRLPLACRALPWRDLQWPWGAQRRLRRFRKEGSAGARTTTSSALPSAPSTRGSPLGRAQPRPPFSHNKRQGSSSSLF